MAASNHTKDEILHKKLETSTASIIYSISQLIVKKTTGHATKVSGNISSSDDLKFPENWILFVKKLYKSVLYLIILLLSFIGI